MHHHGTSRADREAYMPMRPGARPSGWRWTACSPPTGRNQRQKFRLRARGRRLNVCLAVLYLFICTWLTVVVMTRKSATLTRTEYIMLVESSSPRATDTPNRSSDFCRDMHDMRTPRTHKRVNAQRVAHMHACACSAHRPGQ